MGLFSGLGQTFSSATGGNITTTVNFQDVYQQYVSTGGLAGYAFGVGSPAAKQESKPDTEKDWLRKRVKEMMWKGQ